MGLYRIFIPDFDKCAFREALANAFCHRNYSRLGRVRLQINDEGITISNQGGFIEGINADNLLNAEPHGRNPVLADAMKRIGLAERTGRGIDRIYEESLLYGLLLPDYSQSTDSSVRLLTPRGLPDKAFVSMILEEQKRVGHSLPIYSLLILNVLKQLHQAMLCEISQVLKQEESRLKVVLEILVESGLVEAWEMAGAGTICSLPKPTARTTRRPMSGKKEAMRSGIRSWCLKLARKQEEIRRADVVTLLHISTPKAYRLLRRLQEEGKLALHGKGAGAYYTMREEK